MKTLKDFIKESQEINESLLGDIIRKLLDTSLSWIGSSAKWVADHVAKTTTELWNTTKHITDKGWDRLRFRSGYGGYGAPRDEYEYTKITLQSNYLKVFLIPKYKLGCLHVIFYTIEVFLHRSCHRF